MDDFEDDIPMTKIGYNDCEGRSWPDLRMNKRMGEYMNINDGIVGAIDQDNRYLITTPNVEFVPELHFGFDRVKLRADARFGIHDPLSWPQMFQPSHQWMSCVLRRPTSPLDRLSCMWRTPTIEDFQVTYSHLEAPWGLLKRHLRKEFATLVNMLYQECQKVWGSKADQSKADPALYNHATRMRNGLILLDYAGTFRDVLRQVVSVQRFYLYTKAILDWHTTLAPRLREPGPHDTLTKYMGVFTLNPDHAARLFDIGIPVWLLRKPQQLHEDVVVKRLVDLTMADSIVTKDGEFGNEIYHGRLGLNHLEAITRHGNQYLDIDTNPYGNAASGFYRDPNSSTISGTSRASSEQVPQPELQSQSQSHSQSQSQSQSQAAGSKQPTSRSSKRPKPYTRPNPKEGSAKKPSQLQGCDKRAEPTGDWVPSPCPTWAEAVRSLDIENALNNPNELRLHVPEPLILFNAEKEFRRNLYVRHWVLFREALVYSLRNSYHLLALSAPSNQDWRFYFTYGPDPTTSSSRADTRTARRKTRVAEYHRQVFQVRNSDNVSFFGENVPEDNIPVSLLKKVAWDLYELGFRQGLITLDRHLCKASDEDEVFRISLIAEIFPDGHAHAITELPTANVGLAADSIHDRAASLDAFRRVLKRWPTAPEAITKMKELTGECGVPFLESAERTLAQYYCKDYLAQTGRVPIVPRKFPLA